jgi:hypothetical protein
MKQDAKQQHEELVALIVAKSALTHSDRSSVGPLSHPLKIFLPTQYTLDYWYPLQLRPQVSNSNDVMQALTNATL